MSSCLRFFIGLCLSLSGALAHSSLSDNIIVEPDNDLALIEEKLGIELSAETAGLINEILVSDSLSEDDNRYAEMFPTGDVLGRKRHHIEFLFCAGVTAGVYRSAEVSKCTTKQGTTYWINGQGIGGSVGAAVEAFVMAINKRKNAVIDPFFLSAAGTTSINVARNLLNLLPSPFSAKASLFHTINGSQAGAVVGVQAGAYRNFGEVKGLNIFDTYEELVSDLKNIKLLPAPNISTKDREERRQSRRERLKLQCEKQVEEAIEAYETELKLSEQENATNKKWSIFKKKTRAPKLPETCDWFH